MLKGAWSSFNGSRRKRLVVVFENKEKIHLFSSKQLFAFFEKLTFFNYATFVGREHQYAVLDNICLG